MTTDSPYRQISRHIPSLTASIGTGIALVTLIVFAGSLGGGFVWDDEDIITTNEGFRSLDLPHLRWMVTNTLSNQWVPLMWLTFGFDHLAWGLSPTGYHATNIVLHAVNAALFYLIALSLLMRSLPRADTLPLHLGAVFAALFFALHPLRVESVAWVSARRDVLSGFFFLLSIVTYVRASAVDRRRRRLLIVSVLSYGCALLAKPIVAPLPLLLIILDVYPLRRLGVRPSGWITPPQRTVWLEKLPYFLLSLGASLVALLAIAHADVPQPGLGGRLASFSYGAWFYVKKTLLPVSLSPLYSMPAQLALGDPQFIVPAVGVLVVTGGLVLLARRWPALIAVWAAYILLVIPASVRIHGGPQLVADRYSYLACLGWALLAGCGVTAITSTTSAAVRPAVRRLAIGLLAIMPAGLALLTWWQVGIWHDAEGLWRYAVDFDQECAVCRSQLGRALNERGRYEEAIEEYRHGLALRPRDAAIVTNLSYTLLRLGRPQEALEAMAPVLDLRPEDPVLQSYLVWALTLQGRQVEASIAVSRLVALRPARSDTLVILGFALIRLGRPDDAVPYLRRAAETPLASPMAYYWLAQAYSALGDAASAGREAEQFRVLDRRAREELVRMGRP